MYHRAASYPPADMYFTQLQSYHSNYIVTLSVIATRERPYWLVRLGFAQWLFVARSADVARRHCWVLTAVTKTDFEVTNAT